MTPALSLCQAMSGVRFLRSETNSRAKSATDAARVADQVVLVAQLGEFRVQPLFDDATALEVTAGVVGSDRGDAWPRWVKVGG